jgi:hypothetical protein
MSEILWLENTNGNIRSRGYVLLMGAMAAFDRLGYDFIA